jgi:hypothetical protein
MRRQTISKTQANKIINECFAKIPNDLHISWSDAKSKLFAMELDAERSHRKGGMRVSVSGFSASQAAKYFTVSHLFDAMENGSRYTVDDIIAIRNECLYAQAYANKFRQELQAWYEYVKQSGFSGVDYADMME